MNAINTKNLTSTLKKLYVDNKEKGFSNLYWGEFLQNNPNLKTLYLMNDIGSITSIAVPISKKVCLPFIYIFRIVWLLI